jgi:hypothetical protein
MSRYYGRHSDVEEVFAEQYTRQGGDASKMCAEILVVNARAWFESGAQTLRDAFPEMDFPVTEALWQEYQATLVADVEAYCVERKVAFVRLPPEQHKAPKTTGGRPKKVTPYVAAQVKQLRQQGLSIRAILHEMEKQNVLLTYGTVQRTLSK